MTENGSEFMPDGNSAANVLRQISGLSAYPVDGRLTPLPDASTYNSKKTNLERLRAFAKENLTIREIFRRISNAGTGPVIA